MMEMTNFQRLRKDSQQTLTTFAIALCTGWLFLQLKMPAPFLMGSLFGVWIIGSNIKALQPHLGVARWFHVPVVLGLGVLIGSYFSISVMTQAYQWLDTAIVMMLVTCIVTASGFLFLTKWRGYDPLMAFFCAIPGGQAEALIMAREQVEKDYVVALFHLIRVTIVFFSTPLLLAYFQGAEAVAQSNTLLTTMPSLSDMSVKELGYFMGLGISGYITARLMRWPMPHLFGPVVFSAIAHMAGLIQIPRIFEFVLLAQLSIGGAVGARLACVKFRELLGYLKDACLMSLLILSLYFLAAASLSALLDQNLLGLWLAFVPGGLYEVTLLALLFGFDIAFVAFHHTIRIILIFISLPVMAVRFGKKPR